MMSALGSSPSTNLIEGVLRKPIGGGDLALVAKIMTSLKLAFASPSKRVEHIFCMIK